jgi:predicted dehydrogenase
VSQFLRAALIGPGRIGSTYDDEVVNARPRDFFRDEHRHPGLYTILPVNHAKSYLTTPGYELAAVAGRGEERLLAFAERWPVAGVYDDAERMLNEVRPDVVSICSQSAEKASLTVAAANAGVKAIIVEKAMATSASETDAMIEACDRAGAMLVVNHPFRFSPVAREARALIDAGEIGEIGSISAWSRGGMIHVGTHTFDMLRFFGGDIDQVVAWGPVEPEWSDRPADVMVRFRSGVTGFVSHTRDAFPGFEIRGTRGAISISQAVGESWIVRASLLDGPGSRAYPLVGSRQAIGTSSHDMSVTQRLLTEVRDAMHGGEPVRSTGRDGQAALEAGIAALVSAKSGTPVSLPLTDRSVSIPNR